MPTIAEFLNARLDEDEQTAAKATGKVQVRVTVGDRENCGIARVLFHRRFRPVRILAEVAAKRALLKRLEEDADRCTDDAEWRGASFALDKVLEYLAAPYADHPDYDPTWSLDAPY